MTSKQAILKAIRDHEIAPVELPALEGSWIKYDDRLAQFQSVVAGVGGRCVRVATPEGIHSTLASLPEFASAKSIVSQLPNVAGNVRLDDIADPHELETIDFAVMPAEFGVAENGAIWLTDIGVTHRAIYFIVQHLALVLPTDAIVHNMHEAYERITVGNSSLGIFISGPSKTADIEQSLVIGAHGPRSLTVISVDRTT